MSVTIGRLHLTVEVTGRTTPRRFPWWRGSARGRRALNEFSLAAREEAAADRNKWDVSARMGGYWWK